MNFVDKPFECESLEAYHQTYVGVAELPTVKEYFEIKSQMIYLTRNLSGTGIK